MKVGGASLRFQQTTDHPQGIVAGEVIVNVVEFFEVIDIEQQEAEWLGFQLELIDAAAELGVEGTVIGQAGESIGEGFWQEGVGEQLVVGVSVGRGAFGSAKTAADRDSDQQAAAGCRQSD